MASDNKSRCLSHPSPPSVSTWLLRWAGGGGGKSLLPDSKGMLSLPSGGGWCPLDTHKDLGPCLCLCCHLALLSCMASFRVGSTVTMMTSSTSSMPRSGPAGPPSLGLETALGRTCRLRDLAGGRSRTRPRSHVGPKERKPPDARPATRPALAAQGTPGPCRASSSGKETSSPNRDRCRSTTVFRGLSREGPRPCS